MTVWVVVETWMDRYEDYHSRVAGVYRSDLDAQMYGMTPYHSGGSCEMYEKNVFGQH